jgi:hypothetical protein
MRLASILAIAGLCLGNAGQGSAQNRRAAVYPAIGPLIAFDMPRGWRPIGSDTNPFRSSSMIATTRHIMHGTALPEGNNAAIQIWLLATPGSSAGVDRLLRGEAGDDRILSSRNLPDRPGREADCATPAEVLLDWEVAPGVHSRELFLVCRRAGLRLQIRLDYWPGDRRAGEYRRRALAVAGSLRLVRSR